ncbi:MAG: NmrA family NAD(P)-binding protein [Bryobacteraceae bacterium]|nr:NmrA family NAD(P)-binding protein [Bryobacteraceae bacterium]
MRYADLDDADSMAEAFSGEYGVYGVTTMLKPTGKLDMEMERRQGRNIADACVANFVEHLVLSTIPYFGDGPALVPYIRSKLDIEAYVVEKAVPYTFLGPGSFMDEIGGEYLPVKKRVLTGQAADDVKIPYVACRDIGEFARLAFARPSAFIGRKLTLIGDFISGEELAQVLSRVSGGKPFRHKAPPIWLLWIFAREWITLRKQFESWGRPPHPQALLDAIVECHRLLPDILSFEGYLRTPEFGKVANWRNRRA